MGSNLVRGLAWIGLSILCWMPMVSVAKRTLEHVDAFSMASLRYGIGVALLVALLAATEGWRALSFERKLAPAIVLGLCGITGFNLFLWIGLLYTRPEHAAVILQLQAPLIALTLWLVRGQRPARFTLGCVAFAITGALLVVTRGDLSGGLQGLGDARALLGDLLVFLAALSWVAYTLSAGVFAGWSALRMTVLTCIPGVIGLFAMNAIAFAVGWAAVPTVDKLQSVAGAVAYFAICTVVLGILGFNNAARLLGPLNAMLMLNLVPVGVFAIEAALGRSFAAAELLGAALVVAALVANNLYLRGARTSR